MITIRLHDGETVTLDADPKDVTSESSALVIRRGGIIIGRFRRCIAWHETPSDDQQ
jgi:hypothetical protein